MPIEIPRILTVDDREAIEHLLKLVGTNEPTLEQIWLCMDAIWDQFGCDNKKIDLGKLDTFYRHPVWLLNGLFIEQHAESLQNREIISDWIAKRGVTRIADFGGGFGTLGRMVASKCLQAHIEVIEPYAHPLAVEKCAQFSNLSYRKALSGQYDLIVAMDVFEHVSDPLRLLYETAHHLKYGGIYLTANCFYPVIKCHLPISFHFQRSWNLVMRMLKLRFVEAVSYGSAFQKTGKATLPAARVVEVGSRLSFPLVQALQLIRSKLKLRTRFRAALARLTY